MNKPKSKATPTRRGWLPYLPEGRLCAVVGVPSSGKSTVVLDIITKLAKGITPTGERVAPVRSIYLGLNDAPRTFVPDDGDALADRIKRDGAGIVVVDPAWTFAGRNARETSERLLDGLASVAARTGACIVLVFDSSTYTRHPASADSSPVDSELMIEERWGTRSLRHSSIREGALGETQRFMFKTAPGSEHIEVEWLGPAGKEQPLPTPTEWLRSELLAGPRPVVELQKEWAAKTHRSVGAAARHLRRASDILGLRKRAAPNADGSLVRGKMLWELPAPVTPVSAPKKPKELAVAATNKALGKPAGRPKAAPVPVKPTVDRPQPAASPVRAEKEPKWVRKLSAYAKDQKAVQPSKPKK